MTDLLPCPFCGSEATIGAHEAFSADSSFDYVGCKDCGAMFEIENASWSRALGKWIDNSPDAIAAWNRRAIPSATVTVADALALPEINALVDLCRNRGQGGFPTQADAMRFQIEWGDKLDDALSALEGKQ